MPGHPVAPAHVETTKAAVRQLEELINQHDVIYLLMDSRESRWLPTLLGAEKGKVGWLRQNNLAGGLAEWFLAGN
jgi:ubiquitin-like modifier-activating enzyme ATG7